MSSRTGQKKKGWHLNAPPSQQLQQPDTFLQDLFFLHLTRRSAIGTHPSKSRQPLLLCFSSNLFLCFFHFSAVFSLIVSFVLLSLSLSISPSLSIFVFPLVASEPFFFPASFASEQRFLFHFRVPGVCFCVCVRMPVSLHLLCSPTTPHPGAAQVAKISERLRRQRAGRVQSMLFIQNLNGAVLVFAGVEVGWVGGAKAML